MTHSRSAAPVLVSFILMVAWLLAGSAAARGGRGEPQPIRRSVQLQDVSEVVGQFMAINGVRYHVHDLAMARTPDAGVVFMRFDLESATGERFTRDLDLSLLPPGSVELHALDEAFHLGGRTLWWADARGEVHGTTLEEGEQPVGPGGTVEFIEGMRCSYLIMGACIPSPGCDGMCGVFPNCHCIGGSTGSGFGSWCLAAGGASCSGRCGVGSCGSESVLGGCTCQ